MHVANPLQHHQNISIQKTSIDTNIKITATSSINIITKDINKQQ